MIYITGDKHADFREVYRFAERIETTYDDILIVLGDAGINYFLDYRAIELKKNLAKCPLTLFCVHGNHEERPENIEGYKLKEFHGAKVYYEEEYPNILFAIDGEVYDFNNNKVLVIGGAYSVDKDYRLLMGYNWYESEQPSPETKIKVKEVLKSLDNKVDIILSHTCPYRYIPSESFKFKLDPSKVDNSTEYFLDDIETNTDYDLWYCGHYHIDKKVDKMIFMFHDVLEFKG